MTYVQMRVIEDAARGQPARGAWKSGWGEVSVVEKVVGYKKIKFHTHENAGLRRRAAPRDADAHDGATG